MHEEVGVAVVNGKVFQLSEASIPILDRGLLFGHSVFETILVEKGQMVQWERHYLRLSAGCHKSLIRVPEKENIEQMIQLAIEENIKYSQMQIYKMAIRIIVTGGTSINLEITKKDNPDFATF